eukprot:TRINITY_DN1999_c0_g1_i1.p1 TRINITY_DN1999_c0_g1~~TRINITY_DN1999_c0_g1_i1.p1  ORF type:complete len:400 (-),score=60.30 TRINITY_DN1999_c0_g1_i1:510-1709(-)
MTVLQAPSHLVDANLQRYDRNGVCPSFVTGLDKSKAHRRVSFVRKKAAPSCVLDLFQKSTGFKERTAFAPWDKVKLGPLDVSPMGLGTWAWGNQLLWGYQEEMDAELQEIFNLVVSQGINLFDTADSYGTGRLNGRSELLLGKFIREYPGSERVKKNVRVATKLASYPWRLTKGQMVNALRGSLARLGQDKVALGQLHWSAAKYAPFQERALWDGLVAMADAGLVDCVGVSNYGPRQLEKIHTYLAQRGVSLASAQVQFSLLSTGPEQAELKSLCDSLNIRMIAYSPLGLGMLTGKYSPTALPSGPRGLLFKQILPGMTPLLTAMQRISVKRKKTMSQVAINWCICKGTVPIPGAKDIAQAKENLGALGWRLSGAEVAELDEMASQVPRPMIQNVFQTN